MNKRPPEARTIRGEEYRLVLFEVTERDEFGTPTVCRLHAYDHAKITLHEGMTFFTAFAHARSVEPTVKPGVA